jgi:hypothetical protein
MSAVFRRCVVAVAGLAALAPLVAAQPASAFPKGDSVFSFNYKVIASTHIKKLNQTITTPPGGRFNGQIDFDTAQLQGNIKLPPIKFTFSEAGLPLATATAQIATVKPVTGRVNLNNFRVTATSTFNLRLVSVYAATPVPLPLPPVNLVGNSCTTATPIVVTMSGIAKIGAKSTFKGTFTIPNFKTCGALTTVLNQLIPGPGNTFSATASP